MVEIVIFGSAGMLGNYCFRYLKLHEPSWTVRGVKRAEFDAVKNSDTDLETLLKSCFTVVPDSRRVVINAIMADRKSSNLYETMRTNTHFPAVLQKLSSIWKYTLIHISTDGIFTGLTNTDGYDEKSNCDEVVDHYAVSKRLAEQLILPKACIIRTSLIGEGRTGLMSWLISQRGQLTKGFTNHRWNGVTCLELSKLIHRQIANNKLWEGIRHIFSPKAVTKFELLFEIDRAFGLGCHFVAEKAARDVDRTLRSLYDETRVKSSIESQIWELRRLHDTYFPHE